MSYSDLKKKHGITKNTATTNSKTNSGSGGYSDLQKKHGISYDVDEKFINTFLTDANRFITSAQDEYNKVGWNNASSFYESRFKAWEDLDSRYSTVSGWLFTNKNSLDKETYNSLSDALSQYKSESTKIISAFKDAKETYGQFKSEEDYNKYRAEHRN